MSLALDEEIARALHVLPSEDRKRIDVDKAKRVVETLLEKRVRIHDKGVAIRNTLAERHIGTQGFPDAQQKIFRAYWRLLRKVMDNRERRNRSERRKRRTV